MISLDDDLIWIQTKYMYLLYLYSLQKVQHFPKTKLPVLTHSLAARFIVCL